MIKLIPCPKITKRELMTALMEGRRFCVDKDSYNHETLRNIHWDDNHGNSPVRMGVKPWDFRGFCYLHEITESHWYDNIPEEGVLCWVWDDYNEMQIGIVTKYYYSYQLRKYKTYNNEYIHAKPIIESDLYQEPV